MFGVDDSQPAYSFDSTAQIESPSIEQFFKSIKLFEFLKKYVGRCSESTVSEPIRSIGKLKSKAPQSNSFSNL